jgi:hypothetical protein
MTPIEKVLSRLPGHRTAGDGFKACCPSHEDRTPSLSIREASDGTVLIKCFGGCPTSQIVSDLELDMADLFPDAHKRSWPANSSPKSCSQPRNFVSADDAISAYGRGRPDRKWTYTDASGAALGHTLRWQTNAGKDIRPVAKGPVVGRPGAQGAGNPGRQDRWGSAQKIFCRGRARFAPGPPTNIRSADRCRFVSLHAT